MISLLRVWSRRDLNVQPWRHVLLEMVSEVKNSFYNTSSCRRAAMTVGDVQGHSSFTVFSVIADAYLTWKSE